VGIALLEGIQELSDVGVHQPQIIPAGMSIRQQLTWDPWSQGTVSSIPSVRTELLRVQSGFTRPVLSRCRR
jgi:hypothetical protein